MAAQPVELVVEDPGTVGQEMAGGPDLLLEAEVSCRSPVPSTLMTKSWSRFAGLVPSTFE